MFTWDWSHRLAFPTFLLQIDNDKPPTKARQEGGSAEIHPGELMAPRIYDEKFLMGMRLLFGTLPFTMGEEDNFEHPTQEQEKRHTKMIGFKFHRGLKNSVTTFQAAVRQPATTNPIDSLTRLLIGTPSMTTRSSELALSEIWITKPEESAWSGVAIGKQSIPPTNTQWSIGLRWQNVTHLHQVALHLSPDFSTVRSQGQTYGTNQGSHSRTGAHWAIDKQCTTTSERTYPVPISRTWLARSGQRDIFVLSRYAYSIQNSNVS
jgi:hypothetical protein